MNSYIRKIITKTLRDSLENASTRDRWIGINRISYLLADRLTTSESDREFFIKECGLE